LLADFPALGRGATGIVRLLWQAHVLMKMGFRQAA
jgi:hypothetical protein